MSKDLHVYRNLGVPCAKIKCRHCKSDTIFSAYFEIDSKRQRQCSVGCNDCGRGYIVSEAMYESLYELSFDFDGLKEGKISEEEYQEITPAACKTLFAKIENKAKAEASVIKAGGPESPAKDWPKPGPKQGEMAAISLYNATSDALGTGYVLALLAGLVFGLFGFLVELPEWMKGWVLLASYAAFMALGLYLGAMLSHKRFPKRVRISAEGIEIEPRGARKPIRCKLRDVSRVNFGAGAKYLTLWLASGDTFVVRVGKDQVREVERYFGEAR